MVARILCSFLLACLSAEAFVPVAATARFATRRDAHRGGADSIPSRVEVAVVGGGLGGLAAAAALRRRGIDAHVFEGAEKLLRGSTGTGIMISVRRLHQLLSPC